MTNNLASKIYAALKAAGVGVNTIEAGIIQQVVDDAWVPVGERLPEALQEMLICATDGTFKPYQFVAYHADGEWYRVGGRRIAWNVTHWQPLPPPPGERAEPGERGCDECWPDTSGCLEAGNG